MKSPWADRFLFSSSTIFAIHGFIDLISGVDQHRRLRSRRKWTSTEQTEIGGEDRRWTHTNHTNKTQKKSHCLLVCIVVASALLNQRAVHRNWQKLKHFTRLRCDVRHHQSNCHGPDDWKWEAAAAAFILCLCGQTFFTLHRIPVRFWLIKMFIRKDCMASAMRAPAMISMQSYFCSCRRWYSFFFYFKLRGVQFGTEVLLENIISMVHWAKLRDANAGQWSLLYSQRIINVDFWSLLYPRDQKR